ncbi:MAG: hypothetical protein AAFR71_03640 [Pseudomonadota bacterium]
MKPNEKLFIYLTAAWFAVLAGFDVFFVEPMADGQKGPDSQPLGYTYDAFAGWASALDSDERSIFLLWHTRILDFVFPLMLMAALYILLTAALRSFQRFRQQPAWIRVAVPLALVAPYGLFDYLENGLVANMLRGALPIDPVSVGLASSYTVLKYSFLVLAAAALGVFWLAARRTSQKGG